MRFFTCQRSCALELLMATQHCALMWEAEASVPTILTVNESSTAVHPASEKGHQTTADQVADKATQLSCYDDERRL